MQKRHGERRCERDSTGMNQLKLQQRSEDKYAWAIDHVVCGGGNCTAQGPCYYGEVSPTLKSAGVHAVVMVYGKEILPDK